MNSIDNHQDYKFDIASCEKKYFKKCQVYTPIEIIEQLWKMLHNDKTHYNKVLDLGAGDGRFSLYGNYNDYLGLEIDKDIIIRDLPLSLIHI